MKNKNLKQKKCSKCSLVKPISDFGLATERYKEKVYKHPKSCCRECEAKDQLARHNRRKNNAEYKIKQAAYARKRYWLKREELIKQQREYRKSEKAKEIRREYIKKNKAKIQAQEKIAKMRYHVKNRNPVTDTYVVNLLRCQGYGTREEIINNHALIEQKRIQILNKRLKNMIAAKKRTNGKERH